MAALFLSEADVDSLLTMADAIEAVTQAFRRQAMTEVMNIARGRARTDLAMMHLMGAAAKTLNALCCKVYTTTKKGAHFYVHLFDGKSGELISVMQGKRMGAIRTGAVSGLATQFMARTDANTVGVIGSGLQARTQLEAVCQARSIVEAYVYSPNPEHREIFAKEMATQLGVEVRAVTKPELAVEDKDIIVTATDSVDPVVIGDWISEGTHINAVGSNFIGRAELDVETLRKCEPIIVDDKEQCRLEAGDFSKAMEEGVLRWSDIGELGNVVVNRTPGRHTPEDVTLFKSVGVAFADLAVARLVYDLAVKEGVGIPLPF